MSWFSDQKADGGDDEREGVQIDCGPMNADQREREFDGVDDASAVEIAEGEEDWAAGVAIDRQGDGDAEDDRAEDGDDDRHQCSRSVPWLPLQATCRVASMTFRRQAATYFARPKFSGSGLPSCIASG